VWKRGEEWRGCGDANEGDWEDKADEEDEQDSDKGEVGDVRRQMVEVSKAGVVQAATTWILACGRLTESHGRPG